MNRGLKSLLACFDLSKIITESLNILQAKKVKFALEQAINAQRGSRGNAVFFF